MNFQRNPFKFDVIFDLIAVLWHYIASNEASADPSPRAAFDFKLLLLLDSSFAINFVYLSARVLCIQLFALSMTI